MEQAKLFTGFFSRDERLFPACRRRLERLFGRIDFASPLLDFTHTDYYTKEFGTGLKRQFVTFEKCRSLEGIYKAKIATNRLEARFARDRKRAVNIDPGYLTLSKVVLLTTKDYTHRLYVGKKIFAEVTLYYQGKTFNPWPWTYPDYKTAEYIGLFNDMRQRFHKEAPEAC